MGSYATGRFIFDDRSLGTSQAVRSAALIGPDVAAPTDGVAVSVTTAAVCQQNCADRLF